MAKINIFSLTLNELKEILKNNGIREFRANIIYKWLYEKYVFNFQLMTDISKEDRDQLSRIFILQEPEYKHRFISKIDKTKKYAFKFNNSIVETVLIPDNKRNTICLSSQTGCSLKCRFCATGQYTGRNLKVQDIIYQFMGVQKDSKKRITNIVFMGMGEPFLNRDNVFKAIEILNSPNGVRIGARKITISTAGIVPGILSLIDFPYQVKLAVSLNSAVQEKREYLMPVTKQYTLKELKKALLKYQEAKNKRITFEYILLPGFNDSEEDIKALFDFLRDIDSKINIIPYNKTINTEFREPDDKEVIEFKKKLYAFKDAVSVRKSKGRDISGACGQLKGKITNKS